MKANEEWAIQDKATGEWYCWSSENEGFNWGKGTTQRFDTFFSAANAGPFRSSELRRNSARIVPAPPREMTDEECWEWFKRQNGTTRISWANSLSTYVLSQVKDTDLGTGHIVDYGRGPTPCDAIRAARRKLESK